MCRKNCLRGYCCLCFGLGLMAGYFLEGWLLCCGGGLGLVLLGVCIARSR